MYRAPSQRCSQNRPAVRVRDWGKSVSPRGARTGRAISPRTARGAASNPQASATDGFEAKLWQAADKLRNNMDAAEYKHVVLGLIFLKYISDAFEAKHAELEAQNGAGRRPRRPRRVPRRQHLLGAEGGPLVAPQGQRAAAHHRQARRRRDGRHRARQPVAQGRAAQGLRPARPRQAAPRRAHRPDQQHRPRRRRPTAPRTSSAASTSTSSPSSPAPRARRAASSTRRRCVVRVLVEMLAPYKGRVYDPCCGSGGMFVQQREVRRGARRQASATSPSTARSPTTPPGGWPR